MSLLQRRSRSQLLKQIFTFDDVTSGSESLSAIEKVKARCVDLVSEECEINDVITCASDLIDLFVQMNWTGPPVKVDAYFESLVGGSQQCTCSADLLDINKQSLQQLSWDGEPAYSLVNYPLLLYTAHLLLELCSSCLHGDNSSSSLYLHRWRLRCLFLQQKLLSQRSASLWEKISKVVMIIKEIAATVQQLELELCEFNLELGHVFLYYSMFEQAQEHFAKAKEAARLTFDLTGALGKRTKFQQQDVAQLVLRVTSDLSKTTEEEAAFTTDSLPKNLLLGDDTLLEHIKFTNPQSTHQLTPLQQAVLIGHCVQLQRSSPAHRLSVEECEAYVNCVLATPQCWPVECNALYLRCKLERQRRRTVERAMTQLEELVSCYSKPRPDPVQRLSLVYSIPLPPIWTLQKELASTLVSLGCLQSALELFEHLEMWEEMAECLQAVGRSGKAEEVLRQQIALNETPALWCLLGDVTKDPSCYTKAWELSNHHSARAQRSLGLFHLRQEHYEESIESLQLSLSINSLQENLWFSLGCAADRLGKSELAIKSYRRCVTLEPDFAEAWNNLASAYLKVNEKVRAYRVFKEALKCSYDNWKMWENLLVVSADVRAFHDTIRAYHRLMDLREKFVDVEVLSVLVKAVVENVMDISDCPAQKLRSSLAELLGRVAAQTTSSADVWKLYAEFHLASDEPSDHDKALMELQKAARTSKLEPGWDREINKLKRVVSMTMDYCQTCRRICESRDQSRRKDCLGNLSSAKLALQSVLTKASGFGLTASAEVDQLIEAMKEEKQLLLTAIDRLNL